MANDQLTLAFTVKTTGTSYGPAKAATDLGDVPLYANQEADPVLGQLFGITVASDMTVPIADGATRTIVLNMTSANTPTAPPPFPCNPVTATPPVPPYRLLKSQPLPGSFLTVPGSPVVVTSDSQVPSLVDGATVQFLAQPGVFYTIAGGGVAAGMITLTTPYTGTFSEDDGAVRMLPAPSRITAIYSTSPLDSDGVAITPPLPAGSGARTVQFRYLRSDGSGPFTTTITLMGKFPVLASLDDVAVITDMHVVGTGAFGNSVGQITLCELSTTPPAIPSDADAEEFAALIDQAQLLITRGLVYLPPSLYALAQQGNAAPPLDGEFQVVQGNRSVATTVDQSAVLSAGNTIQFAAQPDEVYTIDAVGKGNITLTTPYTGLNENPILSSATRVDPTQATVPVFALASTLAEFVNPGTAVPPPNPPLAPQTMTPTPTFLSGLFARTIQLALAVPVVQSEIVVS